MVFFQVGVSDIACQELIEPINLGVDSDLVDYGVSDFVSADSIASLKLNRSPRDTSFPHTLLDG